MPKKPISTNFTKTRKSMAIIRDKNGMLKKTTLTKSIEPEISERNSKRSDRQFQIAINKYRQSNETLKKSVEELTKLQKEYKKKFG